MLSKKNPMQMEVKKKEERKKEEKKEEYSLLNYCSFSKTKLPKLVIISLTALISTGLDFGTSSNDRLTNVINPGVKIFLP